MEWQYILLAAVLTIAFYTDVTRMKIPNLLTVSASLIALTAHGILSGWPGLLFSIFGFMVGFGVFLILYFVGAIAAGDVKLFGAIGAATGIEFVLYSSMYSIVYAGLIGLLILLFRREFMKRVGNVLASVVRMVLFKDVKEVSEMNRAETLRFPFMYAVLPGVLTTYYYFTIG